MIKNAAKYATESDGSVRLFESRRMVGISFDGLAMRLKKADEDNRTSNLRTRQVRRSEERPRPRQIPLLPHV